STDQELFLSSTRSDDNSAFDSRLGGCCKSCVGTQWHRSLQQPLRRGRSVSSAHAPRHRFSSYIFCHLLRPAELLDFHPEATARKCRFRKSFFAQDRHLI